ncbi:DNA repair protein complementing XP-C cells homolog isoform X2 [Drosophila eugracilis]|uniref:DNA repair protein complementing XP-C cells homolog isoform X2 n=1 Tax=Drosophila eugracilis TaxID=29029 RepID=UPI0007E5E4F5|nr:DNA repair protein complementing XP-C cells homolog isoform X2 [Drosophila eugracilis]
MSDEEEDSVSEGFSASEDEWRPSKDAKGGESSDDDDSEFDELQAEGGAAGSSGRSSAIAGKRGDQKPPSGIKGSSVKKRKPTGQSLRSKLYNKYRPPPKTFPTSPSQQENSPRASGSKNARTPNESGVRNQHDHADSSSESSVEDYLVNPADLDLHSTFFAGGQKEKEKSPAPQFDCNAGITNLSDSGSGSEDNNDSSFEDKAGNAFDFRGLLENANSLERTKEALSKRNVTATPPGSKAATMDVNALLALGENQNYQKVVVDESEGNQRRKAGGVPAAPPTLDEPSRLSKTKSTRIKRHTKTRPVSTVVANAGDTDDSDFEEVADADLASGEDEDGGTPNISGDLEIHVGLQNLRPTKEQKTQHELEMALKRRLNRDIKDRQLLLHKVSLMCQIARSLKYNRLLSESNELMQAALKLLPSRNAYPTERGVELKYLQSFVTWFKTAIKLLNPNLYSEQSTANKKSIVDSLLEQIKRKEARCKQDMIFIFIVLARGMGMHCRLIVNLQPMPLRPAACDLIPIKLKPDEKNKSQTIDSEMESEEDEKPKKHKKAAKAADSKKENGSSKSTVSKEAEKKSNEKTAKKESTKPDSKPSSSTKSTKKGKEASKLSKALEDKNEVIRNSLSSKLVEKSKQQKSTKSSKSDTSLEVKPSSSSSSKPLKKETEPPKSSSSKMQDKKELKPSLSSKLVGIKNQQTSFSSSKSDTSFEEKPSTSKAALNSSPPATKPKPQLSLLKRVTTQSISGTAGDSKKSRIAPLETFSPVAGRTRRATVKPKIEEKPQQVIGSPVLPKLVMSKVKQLNKKHCDTENANPAENHPKEQHSTGETRSRSKSPKVLISPSFLGTKSTAVDPVPAPPKNHKSPETKARISPNFLSEAVPSRQLRNRGQKAGSTLSIPQLDGSDDIPLPKKRPKLEKLKNSQDSDEVFEPARPVKKAPVLPKSVQNLRKDRRVMSTDDEGGSRVKRRLDASDMWVEVWSEVEEQWICIDMFKGKLHCVDTIRKNASPGLAYVFAFQSDQSLKDVTARYCTSWCTTVRKSRVDKAWLDETIAPYLGRRTMRDITEDEQMRRIHANKPLPKSISEFKDHPLYALERHLLKFQGLYPPDAPTLGFIRGEAVYSRDCVHLLHSREIWLKSARVVKLGEQPYKVVKARPKWDKLTRSVIKDQPLEIFGYWQTQEYEPPTAENGIVPRNAYGNVELFKACMLPKKTVHLRLPGLMRVCKKLNIDCANAVVGFDFHQGACHPMYDGFIVCEEFGEVVTAAWEEDQQVQARKEQEKYEARVYGNWKKLIKGLLIRERLKKKYNF